MCVALDKAGAQLRDTANRAMTGIPKGRLPKNARGGNHHLAASVSQEHNQALEALRQDFLHCHKLHESRLLVKKIESSWAGVLGFYQKR